METLNLIDSVYDYLAGQRKSYAPTANYASQIGHPCKRNLVYSRLNWQEKELPDKNTLLVFNDGNLHEDGVLDILKKAGFKVTEQQRPFEIKAINVRGRIDAMVDGVPLEIKSMNTYTFQKINSLDDMLNSDKAYIRGYVAQMMIYLLGMSKESGILLLKDKNNGKLKQIDVTLDYAYAEELWKKMLEVEAFVKKEQYPDRIEDRDSCKFCPFKAVCLPDQDWSSLTMIDNDQVMDTLESMKKLKPYAEAYKKADELVKEFTKERGKGEYLFGDKFLIQVTESSRTIYAVPSEIKQKYATKQPSLRKKIIDLNEKADADAA